ncbi:beta-lactamase domain protein [Sinorhizobium fredii USDA 257]|uniref:Beta-lactamase domain protein n=1 Tax=Sinorhizobium fredii (strain USDA 257) TaxID=1185652 RepID=I3WZ00_SINF2|nr:beta-lactamase domain protein [Sinorhizobium fredii USDA 257]
MGCDHSSKDAEEQARRRTCERFAPPGPIPGKDKSPATSKGNRQGEPDRQESDQLLSCDGGQRWGANAARRDVGTQRRPGRPGGLAGRHVPASGRARLGAERGRGAQRRPDHTHRRRTRVGPGLGLAAGRAVDQATGGRRHRSCIRDRRGADPHAHGPHWRAARRRGKDRLRPDLRIHVAAAEVKFWESPDFSRASMPPGFPDALRSAAKRFVNEYQSQLRPFEEEYEVAPGVVVRRTGGHTPGHSVVRLASGGDRLTFAGDAVFAVGFDHPDWHNGFEHDPEEAARVRVRLPGAGGDPRTAGGHSPAVPVRLPCGGRRRPLSLGTGRLGLLTWVRS